MRTPARVLVVDDDPTTMNLVQEFLLAKGYEVSTAFDYITKPLDLSYLEQSLCGISPNIAVDLIRLYRSTCIAVDGARE